MKAIVNDNCTGCELCVETCPEVFVLGDDSMAKVKIDPVPKEQEEACREAAASCPVEAIVLE